MRRNLIVLLAVVILAQCKDFTEALGPCPSLALPQTSYSVHVYPIINKTCAIPQCHSNDFEYGNFNRFEEIKKKADDGKLEFMISTDQMPHGTTDGPKYLTNCEIETIKKWIREGAKNN